MLAAAAFINVGFVYDLFGNVAEWVADDIEPPKKPEHSAKSAAVRKIIRGGSIASTDIMDRRNARPTERLKDGISALSFVVNATEGVWGFVGLRFAIVRLGDLVQ